MASIPPGVLPSIAFAVLPTAMPSRSTSLVSFLTATTLGSFRTIPRPRTLTSVFAVPRSMPISTEKRPRVHSTGLRMLDMPLSILMSRKEFPLGGRSGRPAGRSVVSQSRVRRGPIKRDKYS